MYTKTLSSNTVVLAFTSSLLCLALIGCVTEPHNGQSECPGTPITVSGFAENAGATLQIQALNRFTNAWEVVGVATANTSGTTFGGNTAFFWTHNVTLNALHYTPFSPDAFAKLRVKEVGGSLGFLVTFDFGGVDCVIDQVLQDDSTWFAAGVNCASNASPEITLICLG